MRNNPFELKLAINLEDIYDETSKPDYGDNENASTLLKDAIVEGLEHKIRQMFRQAIDKAIEKSVDVVLKETTQSAFNSMLEAKIKEKLVGLHVKKAYSSEMIPVEDAISVNVSRMVEKLTERHITKLIEANTNMEVVKLQQRYDQEYAVSIIKSLAEGGFLSDKATVLLTNKP